MRLFKLTIVQLKRQAQVDRFTRFLRKNSKYAEAFAENRLNEVSLQTDDRQFEETGAIGKK